MDFRRVRFLTVRPPVLSPVLSHGQIVLAAITSCTNTANPGAMVTAGLLARAAVERGLAVPAGIKTSFAPGSRAVPDYMAQLDLRSEEHTSELQSLMRN